MAAHAGRLLASITASRCRCRSSHPLESNQNLSGFSRARRPTTQEWEMTPRERWGRTRGVGYGCLAGHPHRQSLFSCQRGPAVRRAHLGRWCFRDSRGRTYRVTRSRLENRDLESQNQNVWTGRVRDAGRERPENVEGLPGFPQAALQLAHVASTWSAEEPPGGTDEIGAIGHERRAPRALDEGRTPRRHPFIPRTAM